MEFIDNEKTIHIHPHEGNHTETVVDLIAHKNAATGFFETSREGALITFLDENAQEIFRIYFWY